MSLLAGLLEELPERLGATGVHPRLLERAAQRLLREAGVPGRQRACPGRDDTPLSAPGGRALRGGQADEDPRAGGIGSVLPGGRRAPGAARAPAIGGARRRSGERGGARRDRARACLGDRGGDRRLLPACRLRAHGRGGRRGLRAGDRGGARAPGRLQVGASGAARPAWRRGELRRHRTRPDRRTSAPTRSSRGSTGESSAAAAAGARSTPSRRLRARPSRRWPASERGQRCA